jgi:hypothetical protein
MRETSSVGALSLQPATPPRTFSIICSAGKEAASQDKFLKAGDSEHLSTRVEDFGDPVGVEEETVIRF